MCICVGHLSHNLFIVTKNLGEHIFGPGFSFIISVLIVYLLSKSSIILDLPLNCLMPNNNTIK